MTICNTENGWAEFLHFIEERCSATEFQNWIAPIQFIERNEKEIVLQVPNIFVQEYLLDNHKKHLAHFFPTGANGEPLVRFLIVEAKKPQAAPTATPIVRTAEENAFELNLNPNYQFDNFIEGPSNQFVKSAAMGIAARPGKSYNPLFIHGGVGLGKTHLLHAIGHQARIEHRKLKIQCITTEGFINDLVDHLKTKSIDKMKRFYRTLDILLVDDIQFLQSRLNFEEEFCNTFESLIHQNKQIVITSDKPPGQLKLSERLIARMEWGLVAHVGMPELETRVAIIQQKAEIKGIKIPQPIAFYIAEHIVHNVRQLEGAINRLCAFSRLLGKPIDDEIVEKALGELIQPLPGKKITVEAILKSVAAVYNVRITDIKGETRAQEIVFARQVAMYLAKELIDDTIMKISASFGGKSHSTLLHAWKKIASQVEKDDLLRRQIQLVRRGLEIN